MIVLTRRHQQAQRYCSWELRVQYRSLSITVPRPQGRHQQQAQLRVQ